MLFRLFIIYCICIGLIHQFTKSFDEEYSITCYQGHAVIEERLVLSQTMTHQQIEDAISKYCTEKYGPDGQDVFTPLP